ncbi:hypothetical protein VTJ49DRAFT_7495 [Mycothermus thermophilus]|uniref:Uncharacterized protein n=1 Tax=Humicola insolens TaxID=85995 RepID=A0ABR3VPQ4_HUMIN
MASRSDTELLTEHFGYAPVVCIFFASHVVIHPIISHLSNFLAKLTKHTRKQSLLDEIINSVNFLAERALHSIEQGLLNAPPASLGFRPSARARQAKKARGNRKPNEPQHDGGGENDEEEDDEEAAARRHRDEIESGTHQLETLLWASIDKNFDVFEIYVMRNILCLRQSEMEWLRLGHYEGLDFGWVGKEGKEAGVVNGAQKDGGKVNGDGDKEADADAQEEEDLVWSLAKELEEVDISSATGEGGDDATRWTVGSVNRLRRRLQASQRLHCMLVAERARTAALLSEVRRLVGAVPGTTATAIKTESSATAASATATTSTGGGVNLDNNNNNNDGLEASRTTQTDKTKPPLSFLHNKGDLSLSDASTPLTTTTAFSLSQLQALRELSATLRTTFMPRLAADLSATNTNTATNHSDDSDSDEDSDKKKKKSWRRERLEYVESATRRHLENVRGLELWKDGEVRDGGEFEGGGGGGGGGRGLGRGEVEGLEGIVGLLGGVIPSNNNNGSGREQGQQEEGERMDES